MNEQTAPATPTLPANDTAHWTLVGGTVQQITILFPLNAGPLDAGINNQSTTLNLYHLPFGWLRPASVPLSTARAKHPWLGALYGNIPMDITYIGQYFTCWSTGPVDLDFIADIADVTVMPPQFCVSLAIRIARQIDGAMTASKNRVALAQEYREITGEAMRIDMIIQGDPADDLEELIQVRF